MKKITLAALIIFTMIIGYIGFQFAILKYTKPSHAPSSVTNIVAGLPTLTRDQVATHNSPTDCYLIISNNVYDVTSYIDYHPGGRSNITQHCGYEATAIFSAIHSNFAWNLLKKYQVGVLSN